MSLTKHTCWGTSQLVSCRVPLLGRLSTFSVGRLTLVDTTFSIKCVHLSLSSFIFHWGKEKKLLKNPGSSRLRKPQQLFSTKKWTLKASSLLCRTCPLKISPKGNLCMFVILIEMSENCLNATSLRFFVIGCNLVAVILHLLCIFLCNCCWNSKLFILFYKK